MGWCNLTGLDVLWRIGKAQVDTANVDTLFKCFYLFIFLNICMYIYVCVHLCGPLTGVLEAARDKRYI